MCGFAMFSFAVSVTNNPPMALFSVCFSPEDAYQKQTVIDSHVGVLDVLDTAGQVSPSPPPSNAWPRPHATPTPQDEFTAMREQYMRGGEGFILVYTITEKRSFQEVRKFKEMIDRVRNYEKVPVVVAGNKKDLEHKRQVSTKEGELMAKEFGCPFFETSASLRHNVDEIFEEVVRCIRRKENDDYLASTGKKGHTAAGSKAEGEGGRGFKWLCGCMGGGGEES